MQDEPHSDGVPSQAKAGTPSRMHPSVARSLDDLEFGAVLAVVAGLAAGDLGAARIRSRSPSPDLERVREDLAGVSEVAALLRRGEKLQAEAVPDVSACLARLRVEGAVLEPTELRDIAILLTAARSVAAELGRIREQSPRAWRLLVPLPDKAIDRRLAASVDPAGEVLDTASPALARARREVHAARQRLLRKLEGILRSVDPESDAAVTVRGGRYVIPVRRDSRSRPAGIVHEESASGGTLFVEPSEAVEPGNAFREAQVAEGREVLRVLRELTAMLCPVRESLVAALDMCVAVDDLFARARYAVAVAGEMPEMLPPGGPLQVRDARHPLLLARGVEVVPFSLDLDGSERTLLVSGPNTGGKTVLLKTVPLVAAMAQSGLIPPTGAGTALPMFTRIFTDIGDRQSIAQDLSTFSGHVALLRAVLDGADASSLVLLDEVGSGTDPAEGAALAAAVLVELTRRRAITIATTHLGTLKSLAASTPGVVNGSLQFDATTLSPTYRFRKGVPGRSYGLAIARHLGLDAEVLRDAEGRVSEEERRLDVLLARAEARERELDDRTARAVAQQAELDAAAARLAARGGLQESRERELKAREKDADRRARAEAKRYLLDARREVEAAIAAARAATDEAGIRSARRQLEHAAIAVTGTGEPDVSAAGAAPDLAAGQRIRLPSGMTGDLIEVRSDGKLVVAIGSMKLVAEAAGVQLLDPAPARRTEPASRLAEAGPAASFDIDLRGMTGDEAETAAVAAIDAAVLAEQPFLRIIHGMGTGVVRDRVRRALERDPRVARFAFAPRNQGGTGVTVVEFAP